MQASIACSPGKDCTYVVREHATGNMSAEILSKAHQAPAQEGAQSHAIQNQKQVVYLIPRWLSYTIRRPETFSHYTWAQNCDPVSVPVCVCHCVSVWVCMYVAICMQACRDLTVTTHQRPVTRKHNSYGQHATQPGEEWPCRDIPLVKG